MRPAPLLMLLMLLHMGVPGADAVYLKITSGEGCQQEGFEGWEQIHSQTSAEQRWTYSPSLDIRAGGWGVGLDTMTAFQMAACHGIGGILHLVHIIITINSNPPQWNAPI